jgi:(1->4)-alpha-D-glucan 1-alpha-D-glucosylmutase
VPERNVFVADFAPFARRIARVGMFNSLSQVAIKIASPGVPDFYQGSELWQLQLVDPDNRAAVDYALRCRLLDELRGRFNCMPEERPERARSLLSRMEDGCAKLFVTWKALAARRKHRALFAAGAYVPLATGGTHAQRLCAFARSAGALAAVLVAPRLVAGLVDAGGMMLGHETWRDTEINLPVELAGTYCNVFTSEVVVCNGTGALAAGEVFGNFPVAILLREVGA